MTNGEGRIVVAGLTKTCGTLRAVDGLSFTVEPGTITGFLGPNGAGKTTTLRMLLGLITPDAGAATISGHPYRAFPAPNDQVGAVLEASGFHPARSGRNHLRIYGTVNGYPPERADEVLELVGLAVVPEQVNELLAIGREIKWLLNDSPHAQHPSDDRLSGIYGTIVFDELGTTADGSLHQRNVTIFADGQVDRSPFGSGSVARLAVLDARGELGPGQVLMHDSIVGSTFTCRVVDSLTAGGHPAVIPQITGMAYRCGTSEFTLDPHDPFVAGLVLLIVAGARVRVHRMGKATRRKEQQ
jgi:hypothetical protein